MGNRVGSPPPSAGGGGKEQIDDQPEEEDAGDEDETVQTGIAGAVAGAAAAAAGAAAGSGSPPDGETPEEDVEDGDEPGDGDEPDDDDGEDDSEVPREGPVEPPVDPEQPADSDVGEPAEPVEECGESESEDAPEHQDEDEDDLDDEDEDSRFVYGDIVYDRDHIDEDEVEEEDTTLSVVVNLPEASIAEWEIEDGETIADRDPHYPPTDDVVVVVEQPVLDEVAPSWDEREAEIPLEGLDAVGVEYTAYPSLRLELYEPSHLRGSA